MSRRGSRADTAIEWVRKWAARVGLLLLVATLPGATACDFGMGFKECTTSADCPSGQLCGYDWFGHTCYTPQPPPPQCDAGAKRCLSSTVETCKSGEWQAETTCPYVCMDGGCTGVCKPFSARCRGETIQICSSTGEYLDSTTCSNPHGQTACDAGACYPTCSPGFGDCNRNTADGCETDLSSRDNCGGCDHVCMPQQRTCVAGKCE